jgi:disulfide bond formation protein DsbB
MIYGAFLVALAATLGSLFFSDVMGYPPCVLCWYQRIAMYPLVAVFGTAIWIQDKSPFRFAYFLILAGWIIAFYHNLLYYNVIEESITACEQGISCTSRYIEWLGFITIPLLSLMAFTIIAFLAILDFRNRGSGQ